MFKVRGPGELTLENDFGSTIANIRINPNNGNLSVSISPVIFRNAAYTVNGQFVQVGEEWFPSGEYLNVTGLGSSKLAKPTIRKAITEEVTQTVRNWWVTEQSVFQQAVLAQWEARHKDAVRALAAAESRHRDWAVRQESELVAYREAVATSLARKPQFALESPNAGDSYPS